MANNATTHGMSHSYEYNSWQHMKEAVSIPVKTNRISKNWSIKSHGKSRR